MTATTALLAAGTVGTAAFIVIFLVDGATRPGYRPDYHAVSALALGPRGWVQTANFVACGVLVAASALGMHRSGDNPSLAVATAVFGLALVASGTFAMDPMRGYPPDAPADTPSATSRAHQLHDWAGVAVFTSLPAAAGIAAVTLESSAWSIYSAATAVATTAGLLAFGTAWEQDHPRTGLIQRVTIITGWTWFGATCVHLAVAA